MAAPRYHYPVIDETAPVLLEPANVSTAPDGFDPNRDGAAAWLALRMRHSGIDEI